MLDTRTVEYIESLQNKSLTAKIINLAKEEKRSVTNLLSNIKLIVITYKWFTPEEIYILKEHAKTLEGKRTSISKNLESICSFYKQIHLKKEDEEDSKYQGFFDLTITKVDSKKEGLFY